MHENTKISPAVAIGMDERMNAPPSGARTRFYRPPAALAT